jgi:hypothetical protein
VVADQKVIHRRNAADELAALPPPTPDEISTGDEHAEASTSH